MSSESLVDLGDGFALRPATAADSAGCYAVCCGTGDSGKDASHLYAADPDALGRLYTQPYLELEPAHAFVVVDAGGAVVGYTFGAFDSAAFYRRFLCEYLPAVRARHPDPPGPAEGWSPVQAAHHEYHAYAPWMPPSVLEFFPSHLHIDLLPVAQGRGLGAKVMARQFASLRGAGSPGVHLCMGTRNRRAYGFYKKLGFMELHRHGDDIHLGMRLAAVPPRPPRPLTAGVIEGVFGAM